MNTFKVCRFCKQTEDDICAFRMYQKTDTNDRPIHDFIIVCRQDACLKKIDDDPMLFIEVPWSAGGPGKFMLTCGDCKHRSGFSCLHPDLKANGGPGLEVRFSNILPTLFVCGDRGCQVWPTPVNWCAGNPSE